MSAAQALPPPTEEFNAAKRHYVEQFGAALVSNSYLKITVVCLTAVSIALVLLNIRTSRALHELKPLIIRIDDVGRAEAITYESFQYQPREAEIRYFLMDFVQRHYSRVRATVRENLRTSGGTLSTERAWKSGGQPRWGCRELLGLSRKPRNPSFAGCAFHHQPRCGRGKLAM